MPEIKLRIEDLILDHENPRISHAGGQREALQKVLDDQKLKLAKLASSIVEHGLNPMDRLLVLRVDGKPERFIALEGNRRVAALKLLINPAAMTGLTISEPIKRTFERLAQEFKRGTVEPIPAFELGSRQEGDYWLELRHKGEQEGAGIVGWENAAQQRFRTRSPTIQALDMVTEQGGLTDDQRHQIGSKFPTTTLQRFLEDRAVRSALGLDVRLGKLMTGLPAAEVIKPLRRIVLDLAAKKKKVGDLMTTKQMLDYVAGFGKDDQPDLSKATDTMRSVEEIPVAEFKKAARSARRKPDPSDRKEVVPKNAPIHVTDNRLAEVYKELRGLKLVDAPNAIAVLLRVFLELSVDHFLEGNGGTLRFTPMGGTKEIDKSLSSKLAEVVAMLVATGVPKKHFTAVTRSLSVPTSPMNIDLFHRYIHDRFETPTPQTLTAAWSAAQPLFEKIWPQS
ncbi:MAG: hypothetical protein AB7O56_05395 [Bauldia sp.]